MNTSPAVSLINVSFIHNDAANGATIYTFDSMVYISKSVFDENFSNVTPGVVMLSSNFTIHETHFSN